jgi:hypothetical protein
MDNVSLIKAIGKGINKVICIDLFYVRLGICPVKESISEFL